MSDPSHLVPLEPLVKPVRLPDGVPWQVADPAAVRAGEPCSLRLRFVVGEPVAEGAPVGVLFDGGRNVKGSFRPLQVTDASAPGFVRVLRADGSPLEPLQCPVVGTVTFAAPPGGLAAGETLHVEVDATTAPSLSLPSKMVLLFVPVEARDDGVPAINSETPRRVIGACLLHITGSGLHHLRALAPSDAVPGEPFELFIRAEDEGNNVACERPGELIVRLAGEVVAYASRADEEFSACCRLGGLILRAEGVHRLEVEDASHRLQTIANPIRCAPSPDPRRYWGMIHGHTEFSDGTGSIDHYFTYLRDSSGLDFGAVGDHDHVFETTDAMWRLTQEATARYHEPGRFVTFLGYEWAKWRQNGDGDRNVYYLHDHRPMYRSDNGHCPTPPDLYRALAGETALIIPHHPANRGNHCDWKDYDPALDRLVEIYSEWGSSECGAADGNPYPMRDWPPGSGECGEVADGFVQRALALGWRVGFTAGGDDHQGHPGDQTPRNGRPSSGLLAVCAGERTREAIWDALYARRCYGTTGARIIADFTLSGAPMGSELFLDDHPELRSSRRLFAGVSGTAPVETIEIIRNNAVVFTHRGDAPDEFLSWEDAEPFGSIALPPGPHWPTPFVFYYIRLTQTDGEMAWLSPVWLSPRRVS